MVTKKLSKWFFVVDGCFVSVSSNKMCVMDGLAMFSSFEDEDTIFGGLDDEEEYSNVKAAGFGSNSSLELLTTFLSVNGLEDGLDGLDGVTTKGSSSSDPPAFCSSDCCW